MARGSVLLALTLAALAAAVPAARPFVLPIALAALLIAVARRAGAAPTTGAWAAATAIGLLLWWGTVPAPLAAPDGSDCGNPLSPPASWRAIEAAAVLAAVLLLARLTGHTSHEIALGRPSRRQILAGAAIVGLLGPASVLVGPHLAAPFFGPVALPGVRLEAAVPALLFAVSNGTMEELLYRGAVPAWLAPALGRTRAVVVAALLFGLQHATGAEFTGSSFPVILAMATGGLIASTIAARLGSLAIPIAFHVAFDVPLYAYWACRW